MHPFEFAAPRGLLKDIFAGIWAVPFTVLAVSRNRKFIPKTQWRRIFQEILDLDRCGVLGHVGPGAGPGFHRLPTAVSSPRFLGSHIPIKSCGDFINFPMPTDSVAHA